jgi:hypothetical protein
VEGIDVRDAGRTVERRGLSLTRAQAKERVTRIENGEDVPGGFGKPVTHDDLLGRPARARSSRPDPVLPTCLDFPPPVSLPPTPARQRASLPFRTVPVCRTRRLSGIPRQAGAVAAEMNCPENSGVGRFSAGLVWASSASAARECHPIGKRWPGLVFEKRPFLIISAPSTLAYNQTSVSDGGCIVWIDNHSLDRCSLMFATPFRPAAFVSGASTLLPGSKTNPAPRLSQCGAVRRSAPR